VPDGAVLTRASSNSSSGVGSARSTASSTAVNVASFALSEGPTTSTCLPFFLFTSVDKHVALFAVKLSSRQAGLRSRNRSRGRKRGTKQRQQQQQAQLQQDQALQQSQLTRQPQQQPQQQPHYQLEAFYNHKQQPFQTPWSNANASSSTTAPPATFGNSLWSMVPTTSPSGTPGGSGNGTPIPAAYSFCNSIKCFIVFSLK